MEDFSLQKKFMENKGIKSYKPHEPLHIEKNNYLIKVADTEEELLKTFRLRYEVYGPFYKVKPSEPLDIDDYDRGADHIIVMDKASQEILGTYRVLCSDYVDKFYTEREFDLSVVKNFKSRFVEMGRATVSSRSRSGVVINLLWRGLGEYIRNIKADYLIGCATFWTQDFHEVANAWNYFKAQSLLFDKEVTPLENNLIKDWNSIRSSLSLSEDELKAVGKNLPPLVKSYIKAGAKFGGNPANDKKLQSIDFFTICKISEMSQNLVKKYL